VTTLHAGVKAMVLAAGRGERMRPLTDKVPKPLLPLKGTAMIEYPLRALAAAGVLDVVVNLGYRGAQVKEHLGDGARCGVRIAYSEEGDPPLETGGGIFHALPLLGTAPFVLINSDVYSDYPVAKLVQHAGSLPPGVLAHLVLVPNPGHKARGDFGLAGDKVLDGVAAPYTFSGLSVQRAELFARCKPGRFPMLPLWRAAIAEGRVTGEVYSGRWSDVGTPQRLSELEAALAL
jgi:MurNAc alpha-1-phosphate uridylyltransferase